MVSYSGVDTKNNPLDIFRAWKLSMICYSGVEAESNEQMVTLELLRTLDMGAKKAFTVELSRVEKPPPSCIYLSINLYIYIYLSLYIYIYIYMYLSIYI